PARPALNPGGDPHREILGPEGPPAAGGRTQGGRVSTPSPSAGRGDSARDGTGDAGWRAIEMSKHTKDIEAFTNREYEWGFITDIEADTLPPGLDENVIRLISAKKKEPAFMLEWRLRAYRHWAKLERAAAEPRWANLTYPALDYQNISYYSAPKQRSGPGSLDEVDPELLRT